MVRCTHTYAMMDISQDSYKEIADKLHDAGYDHAIDTDKDGEFAIMSGIAVRPDYEIVARPLTFVQLRSANRARLPHFKNRQGESYHSELDGTEWTVDQWFKALVGEVGEFANLSKKFDRGDMPEAEFRAKAAKELADVQCYLDILALRLGIDLGEATREKFNLVSERVGSPVKL